MRKDRKKKESSVATDIPWWQRIVLRKITKYLNKKLDGMKKSWKTSLAGILLLILAVGNAGLALLDGNPATSPDIDAILAAIGGLGLLAARDNGVTSEDVGAK